MSSFNTPPVHPFNQTHNQTPPQPRPSQKTKNSKLDRVSGVLLSLLLHTVLALILALVTVLVVTPSNDVQVLVELADPGIAEDQDAGPTGEASKQTGGGSQTNSDTVAQTTNPFPALPIESLVPMPTPDAADAPLTDDLLAAMFDTAPAGAAEAPAGGPPGEGPGLMSGTSQGFQGVAAGLGAKGLDVVLVLDATESMQPYIEQAREHLADVVEVLTQALVQESTRSRAKKSVRFGVVLFKDYGDEYGLNATKSLKLTSEPQAALDFLNKAVAGGGGDLPEPLHDALAAATNRSNMGLDNRRQTMVILVTDARVHITGRQALEKIVADFSRRRGLIHVVDVGGASEEGRPRTGVLPDLAMIAEGGGGQAFLLKDKQRFWRTIIGAIFGERFEQDVDVILKNYGLRQ